MLRNLTQNFTRALRVIGEALWPFHRRAGYIVPHVIALVLFFLVGASLGWFGRQVYDGRYFRQNFRADLVMPRTAHPFALKVTATTTPSASINQSLFPSTQNQGYLGECATEVTSEVLDFDYRALHPHHQSIRFSVRYLYDRYTTLYDGGKDTGSWPPRVAGIISSEGVPRWGRFPQPPYVIDQTIPASVTAAAARYVLPVTVQDYVVGERGRPIIRAIHALVAGGQPAMISVDDTPSLDNATVTGGIVRYTGPEPNRGGHELVVLAYRPGWELVQNSWGPNWGTGGRAWVSNRWLEHNAWAVEGMTLAAGSR